MLEVAPLALPARTVIRKGMVIWAVMKLGTDVGSKSRVSRQEENDETRGRWQSCSFSFLFSFFGLEGELNTMIPESTFHRLKRLGS
jgi:hypothetical protein